LLGGLFILPMSETEISAGETKPELITTANAAKDRSITLDSPLKTGHVSASYGPILDPFTKEKRFHKGIDIAAPKRTDVLAAAAGIVDSVRIEHISGQGPGKLVIISHEHGLTTKYTQLDTIYVEKGQSVDKGQIIAGVGSSGRSTGPHLHFELLENGENVNPADYIDFSPLMKKRD
jgi:murein DD-endopeptidase MepM/ murein hydrolase activator NlpD